MFVYFIDKYIPRHLIYYSLSTILNETVYIRKFRISCFLSNFGTSHSWVNTWDHKEYPKIFLGPVGMHYVQIPNETYQSVVLLDLLTLPQQSCDSSKTTV